MKTFIKCFKDHKATLLIFLCILAVYGLSFSKRHLAHPDIMASGNVSVLGTINQLSTADAYYWIKVAKDLDAGKTGKGLRDPLKGYPDLEEYPDDPSLLSHFISLNKNVAGGTYYSASLVLVPLLAGLFVFPLFLYFNNLGFGASAVLGGLIGSFSSAYYSRSAIGFVDTDLLNLFFPMTISALIVLINHDRSVRANLLLGSGAGLAMFLFNWWYHQPGFILIYLLVILIYLRLIRLSWKQTASILLLFAFASGPTYLWLSIGSLQHFLAAYISPRPTGQIVWPDLLKTIQETQAKDLLTKLHNLHGFLPIVFAGLLGFLWVNVVRFKHMVPLAPITILGFWSLFGPTRFTMFLAPLLGIGVGVLIEILAKWAGSKFRLNHLATSLLSITLMLGVFFPTISYTAYNNVYGPAISGEMAETFLNMKRLVPKHSAMLTWWDNGYPLMEIGEFATFQDNGTHGGIRTTLIAKALSSSHQQDIAALLSCLEETGFKGLDKLSVENNLTGDQLVGRAFSHPINLTKDNVYVLYTGDMVKTFGNIFEIGTWDFSTRTSQSMAYALLPYFSQAGNTINFKGGKIDLSRGIITEGNLAVPLLATLFVKDGYVADRINYPNKEGVYLQVLVTQNRLPELQVLEEPIFLSNFNQQFVLGNYDRRYFEETYNNVPVARLFRVKSAATP